MKEYDTQHIYRLMIWYRRNNNANNKYRGYNKYKLNCLRSVELQIK